MVFEFLHINSQDHLGNSDSLQCNYVVKKNLLKTCPVLVCVRNDKSIKKKSLQTKQKSFSIVKPKANIPEPVHPKRTRPILIRTKRLFTC